MRLRTVIGTLLALAAAGGIALYVVTRPEPIRADELAAYTPDVNDIPERSWSALENLDLWIVDALRYTGHPSHFSLGDALSWIERFKPRRAVLTNLHSDLDYDVLSKSLPPNVIPAHDGMTLTVEA